MEKDILNELIKMGLNADEIQQTYERYMYLIDKVEILENTLKEVLTVVEPMVNDWTVCPSCNKSWHNHDYDCKLNLAVKRVKSVLPK